MPAATLTAPPVLPTIVLKPPLPAATADDLPWCTCTVPLDGTRPHYRHCDLRGGI